MEKQTFSNLPMIVLLAMLLLGGRRAQDFHSNSNTMLFLAIGETTRESGYGLIIVPIPLPRLEQATQVLMDLVGNTVLNKFNTELPFKENEMYAITRIQDRINLLLSLAQKDGFVSKELQRDQVDMLRDSLLQLPTAIPSTNVPILDLNGVPDRLLQLRQPLWDQLLLEPPCLIPLKWHN